MGIFYVVTFIIFLIVIYYFFTKPIYKFIKAEKEIFRIYEIFIKDKKNIIENNLYDNEKLYCYEFFKWEQRIRKEFEKEIINENSTINSELYITLKEYERWRNSQNRGHK